MRISPFCKTLSAPLLKTSSCKQVQRYNRGVIYPPNTATTFHMHRFNTLDGMRGLAAIAVMVYHYTQGKDFALFDNGDLAVDFFFCLSGFVLAYSYKEKISSFGAAWFLKKRIRRLYPIYLIGIALSLLVACLTASPSDFLYPMLLNLFYLPYFPGFSTTETHALFPYNAPAWSLFFEFFVNALFAWTIFKCRIKWLYATIILSLVWLVSYIIFYKTSTPGWGTSNFFGGFPRVFYSFAMGVLLIEFTKKIKTRNSNLASFIIIGTLAIALIVHHMNGYFWLVSVAILVPIFVYAGAIFRFESTTMRWTSNYLGMVSYPIYCLHMPLYGLITYTIGDDYPVISALASTGAAFLSAHYSAGFFEPSWSKKAKHSA